MIKNCLKFLLNMFKEFDFLILFIAFFYFVNATFCIMYKLAPFSLGIPVEMPSWLNVIELFLVSIFLFTTAKLSLKFEKNDNNTV
jgi:hypothetical protein